jgi:predicted RecA/RadA family phage recombinase
MAKGIYSQKGNVIDFTNSTEADIAYGDVIAVGGRIGIAAENIAKGATGSLNVTGVFEMPADDTTAFAVGDEVYWDNEGAKLTKTPGTYKAGFVTAPKAQAGATALVKID